MADVLDATGLALARLKLEITESVIALEPDVSESIIRAGAIHVRIPIEEIRDRLMAGEIA